MDTEQTSPTGREMIERARAVLGVSMDELAELAGKSPSTLYQVSAGHVKLSGALRASLQNLIAGHESLNAERARNLIAARRRLGSSPERLARLLRISEAELAEYESGKKAIPDDLMDQVHELDLANFAKVVEEGVAPEQAAVANRPVSGERADWWVEDGQHRKPITPPQPKPVHGAGMVLQETFQAAYPYPPVRTAEGAREQIREHVEQVIAACGPDMARLGWVLVELRQRLPVG